MALRHLAAQAGLPLGAAVAAEPLRRDPAYRALLAREFGMVTCENAMKWGPIHPALRTWAFRDADAIVRFATRHAMAVRGHTLVWHSQQPRWLEHGSWSRPALTRVLRAHIATLVGRYRGRIGAWDVVNEAVNDDGTPRPTFWRRVLGPKYLDLAFHAAHRADPKARLFYNDYNAEALGEKSDAILRLVDGMRHRGVPVHGIGLQAHLLLGDLPDFKSVAANITRIAARGLTVQITELDIRIRRPVTAAKLRAQADAYLALAETCLASGACTAFVTWGATDKSSWVPGFFKGYDDALLFDRACRPKPAARSLAEVFNRQV